MHNTLSLPAPQSDQSPPVQNGDTGRSLWPFQTTMQMRSSRGRGERWLRGQSCARASWPWVLDTCPRVPEVTVGRHLQGKQLQLCLSEEVPSFSEPPRGEAAPLPTRLCATWFHSPSRSIVRRLSRQERVHAKRFSAMKQLRWPQTALLVYLGHKLTCCPIRWHKMFKFQRHQTQLQHIDFPCLVLHGPPALSRSLLPGRDPNCRTWYSHCFLCPRVARRLGKFWAPNSALGAVAKLCKKASWNRRSNCLPKSHENRTIGPR